MTHTQKNNRTHCVKWREEPPDLQERTSITPSHDLPPHWVQFKKAFNKCGPLGSWSPPYQAQPALTLEGVCFHSLFNKPLLKDQEGPKGSPHSEGALHPPPCHTQPALELQAPEATHLHPLLAEQLWTQPTSPHLSSE